MMGPHNVRAHAHLPQLFALAVLISLSVLTMYSSFDFHGGSASAALGRPVLAGAVMDVSPTSLTNCRQCMVTVLNKSSNRNLSWSANSRGIPGVTIKPQHGTLQSKGKVSVNITIPSNITCPANGTFIFTGPMNTVSIPWSCKVTPTLTPVTPTSTPSTLLTPSPTPAAIPTQATSSITPTATSAPIGGGQQSNGNPPTSNETQGSSLPSILFSIAALLLALVAFLLYLIPTAQASLRNRLLALILPVSFLRRLAQKH